MAGSRRNSVLRDPWRVSSNSGDYSKDRDQDGFSTVDRERYTVRSGDWENSRPTTAGSRRGERPAPASRFGSQPGHKASHKYRPSPYQGSARPGSSGFVDGVSGTTAARRSPLPTEFRNVFERDSEHTHQRDDFAFNFQPTKHTRTRSPSSPYHRPTPSRPYHHSNYQRHHQHLASQDRERGDYSPSQKRRGHLSGRGAPSYKPHKRGRGGFRGRDFNRPGGYQARRNWSPFQEEPTDHKSRGRSRSPSSGDWKQTDRHRSVSSHSSRSRGLARSPSFRSDSDSEFKMSTNRPARSVAERGTKSPSPLRPIPSYDAAKGDFPFDENAEPREQFSTYAMRAPRSRGKPRARVSRPHVDNRQFSVSPQYGTPNGSRHGSPQPGSPYSGGRSGWGGQSSYAGKHGQSPPYRRNSYSSQSSSQGQYYQNHSAQHNGSSGHGMPPYSTSYRGGHGSYRGNYHGQSHDRRSLGSGQHNYSSGGFHRGRGHFNNHPWNVQGSRGRGGQYSPHPSNSQPSRSPTLAPMAGERMSPYIEQDSITSRPPTIVAKAEDEGIRSSPDDKNIDELEPSVGHAAGPSETPSKGGKFSFAFKAKTASVPAPKAVPDLAQRMQPIREPPQRPIEPSRNRVFTAPSSKFKGDFRVDRRDGGDHERFREKDKGRNRDWPREREDRRDFRDQRRSFREPWDQRDIRRDDQRFSRQRERRDEPGADSRLDPHSEEAPTVPRKRTTKIVTRLKPRPTLPLEFAGSDSVYFRKPGNESVIGAGTYGKVFKAIHIYTKKKVALKKIRMEGEKDGFPVTAVREIKLLQHLRNHNVVSLHEVMVEKNECFMVFEYLSHDLTGLINHPTFTLTAAHKKDLAKQMFEGLSYLHHRGVLHRDIKAANILISNRGQLKFADFGLARFFSKSRQLDYTNRVITIWYRPPELLLGETRYGPAVDVWSAACVYVEMFTKKAVFPGEGGEINQLEKLYHCLGTPTRADWPDLVEMPWFELMRPTERKKRLFEDLYRDVLSPAALDIVAQAFRYDPAKRPTAEEILLHRYFTTEEPRPQQAVELEHVEGDWHEFESKALRKERDKEARRAEQQQQQQQQQQHKDKEKDKEKRKAGAMDAHPDRETKRAKQESSNGGENSTGPGAARPNSYPQTRLD